MKKVIVIGHGMVGFKFCEKLIRLDQNRDCQITVIGDEPRLPYDRVHLSDYFVHRNELQLQLATADWYEQEGIRMLTGLLVTGINWEKKMVKTHQGKWFGYDILVLATGSRPFIPRIEGSQKRGVFAYRTIEDLENIIGFSQEIDRNRTDKVIIVGGGLLGLEAAKSGLDLQLRPLVVEFADRLMPRQLDESGSRLLVERIREIGVQVRTSTHVAAITGEGSTVEAVRLADGSELDAAMVIISAGIRPRDELAETSGLVMGPGGGVKVNEYMQTNIPDIYAIGEVAAYNERTYGLVAPGYEMAEVAANHIVGLSRPMSPSVDLSTKLKLIGVEVASFGDPFSTDKPHHSLTYYDGVHKIYKRFNVSKDGHRLYGGILLGNTDDYNTLLQICKNKISLTQTMIKGLLSGTTPDRTAGTHIDDLPDAALICSCEQVSKLSICQSVDQGCESLQEVTERTRAGTGCGGCKPMVSDLVKMVLKSIGKDSKNVICEHFPYTRQELYDLIRIKQITNFNDALNLTGKGDGCEICKPALASVFATQNNETANRQSAIQDSNDRFLANIQRNGTYSVVPRIPGGEITPEKLIAIGKVSKKYRLYTKITGGQRIDMFGATLNQLPDIWRELIEAGFESGHAYGKALRTVKSCVGSTWCRFGMDESVSFAIEIENRYKGLRSPHKLKGGVSGCIRECAEARSKDFGLIATEKGYNLYICGNGGANPRHALLFAENLDRPTAIKYLDRFLMYYIRTADPLTRTATWLEKLDGGLDYLKELIIEDCLGIGNELEQQMEELISRYQCEWKEVIDNPKIRQRFSHFFNSEEEDTNIRYVKMRDQHMPAPWK
jgi:nitrite reductase (NADH) large subunit